jgi:hypothetical protein
MRVRDAPNSYCCSKQCPVKVEGGVPCSLRLAGQFVQKQSSAILTARQFPKFLGPSDNYFFPFGWETQAANNPSCHCSYIVQLTLSTTFQTIWRPTAQEWTRKEKRRLLPPRASRRTSLRRPERRRPRFRNQSLRRMSRTPTTFLIRRKVVLRSTLVCLSQRPERLLMESLLRKVRSVLLCLVCL